MASKQTHGSGSLMQPTRRQIVRGVGALLGTVVAGCGEAARSGPLATGGAAPGSGGTTSASAGRGAGENSLELGGSTGVAAIRENASSGPDRIRWRYVNRGSSPLYGAIALEALASRDANPVFPAVGRVLPALRGAEQRHRNARGADAAVQHRLPGRVDRVSVPGLDARLAARPGQPLDLPGRRLSLRGRALSRDPRRQTRQPNALSHARHFRERDVS